MSTPTTIKGVITKITHYKAPFFIGAIQAYGHEICILGNVDTPPSKGAEVELTGKYKEHPKYGQQFSFWSLFEKIPEANDKRGVIRILTDKCKGIGPKKAELLYKKLGDKTLDTVSSNPEFFVTIAKIKPELAEHNSKLIKTLLVSDEVRLPLLSWGFSTRVVENVNTVFGDEAATITKEDPYRLVCIKGVSFPTLDKTLLERKLTSANSSQRGMAIAYHLLKEAINSNGHTYMPIADLYYGLKQLNLPTPIDELSFFQGIQEGCTKGLISESSTGCYSLPEVYAAEKQIAEKINQISATPLNPSITVNIDNWLQDSTPNDLQVQAVQQVAQNKISIITGGPGTGKTFVLRGIIKSLPDDVRVALMAPTGKAAKRMSESLSGTNAPIPTTMHKFLRQKPEDAEENVKNSYRDFSNTTLRRKSSEIPDLIIVDELSMVDVFLFSQLLTFAGNKPHFVFIGDVDQLPSIGPGMVLADLINSDRIQVTRLLKNERQVSDSAILYNAYQVIAGKAISIDKSNDWEVVCHENPTVLIPQLLATVKDLVHNQGLDPIRDIQVLSPQNRGTMGVNSLNYLIREQINPRDENLPELFNKDGSSLWRIGDKVVSTKNVTLPNAERFKTIPDVYVVNGDTGIITDIEVFKNMHGYITKSIVTVDFDSYKARYISDASNKLEDPLNNLAQAWAMTVHKAQGSEYGVIIISMSNEIYGELLNRPLLYTAITRGKQKVFIFGSKHAISKAIANNKVKGRMTTLSNLLII